MIPGLSGTSRRGLQLELRALELAALPPFVGLVGARPVPKKSGYFRAIKPRVDREHGQQVGSPLGMAEPGKPGIWYLWYVLSGNGEMRDTGAGEGGATKQGRAAKARGYAAA